MGTYLLSVLHLGTTIALIFYFLQTLPKELYQKKHISFWLKVLLSTLPAGIFGLLFKNIIEERLRSTSIIIFSLLFWGIAIILTDRIKRRKKKITDVTWKQAVAIGVSQIIAFLPGTSRSAITTITGILVGVEKYTSLQFSFLLGLPLLLGASLYGIMEKGIFTLCTIPNCVLLIVSGGFTYITLKVLNKYSKRRWLTFFGVYRIILALILLLLTLK